MFLAVALSAVAAAVTTTDDESIKFRRKHKMMMTINGIDATLLLLALVAIVLAVPII